MTPKLTLNLGVRWDYFGPINETSGGQANFVPYRIPCKDIGSPTFIIPASGNANRTLSTGHPIVCQLGRNNHSCRRRNMRRNRLLRFCRSACEGRHHAESAPTGMARVWCRRRKTTSLLVLASPIRSTPKLVVRGGFGLFFNSFENQGYGPNIGENYPFVFNLSYFAQSNPAVRRPGFSGGPGQLQLAVFQLPDGGRRSGTGNGTANFESGFSCIPLTAEAVNALGVGLQGMQFDYQTPRTYSANLTLQYSLTRSLRRRQHMCTPRAQTCKPTWATSSSIRFLPAGIDTKNCGAFANYPGGSCVPFKDFGGGSYAANLGDSTYHGLQTKLEDQFSNG